MRVLVCGDRNWRDRLLIQQILSKLPIKLVIEGEARGADTLARQVAEELGIPVDPHPANWSRYGRAAGPIRNREMVALNPDLVIAFHDDITSSSGTADMLCQAEDSGILYCVVEGNTNKDYIT